LLDIGSGSGCLLLALLSELPRARGVGVDIDRAALATARHNAAMLGLDGRAAWHAVDATAPGWTARLPGRFDAIVANLPYVRSGDVAGLAPEVADHEPRRALSGGVDGLACFRRVLPRVAGLLAPGGVAVFEVGAGQAAAVAALGRRHRLRLRCVAADLAGIPRCVGFSALLRPRAISGRIEPDRMIL
jgi:release factor glutamine methyltransferase